MMETTRPESTPVADLQNMLRLIYYESSLSADGRFGEETRKSVIRFQKENQLPPTGIADYMTWDQISRSAKKADAHKGCAEHLCIVLQPGQVIEPGSRNVHLFLIQGIFSAMELYYEDMPPVRQTGILDRETEAAIRWLQQRSGLPETGAVDKITWKYLTAHYRLLAGDGSGAYPFRTASAKKE